MEPLSGQVLEANENHKKALDEYTNRLEAQLSAVDKLIAAVEKLPGEDYQEDAGDSWCLHGTGAFKPTSVIDLSDTMLERSPFYEEAIKTYRYKKSLIPEPFSNSERKYLEKAVIKENKRLAAIRAQQSGQDPFAAVASGNEFVVSNIEGIDWNSVARDVSGLNYPLSGRTPQECKVRWIGAQNPNVNTKEWSPDEETQLRDLVEAGHSSRIDWEDIVRRLGTNRSPLDCIKKFQAGTRSTFKWTPALDQKLLDAVQKHGNNNWTSATSVSPEVSANQCQIRYGRSIDPNIKRGKFSAEEDALLMKAVEAYGSDWVKVSQTVPGRTNAQCRDRYMHHLTGGIVKASWEEEEDIRLKEAVKRHGQKWDSVREEMGCTRSRMEYATRYRVLAKCDMQRGADQVEVGNSASSKSLQGSISESTIPSGPSPATTLPVGNFQDGDTTIPADDPEDPSDLTDLEEPLPKRRRRLKAAGTKQAPRHTPATPTTKKRKAKSRNNAGTASSGLNPTHATRSSSRRAAVREENHND